jgi:hypothetical protein
MAEGEIERGENPSPLEGRHRGVKIPITNN